jgi:hypothetical protein
VPAIDCFGVGYIIRRGARGQRQTYERHYEEQLQADEGNKGKDDSCDDHC